jgi:DNA (cytosine-5)-methyltransferase 1
MTCPPQLRLVDGGSGPVIGSLCTGYGGLDQGVIAALGGGRVAWVADPDSRIRALLNMRLPGVPNLGDITAIDWTQVEPVDVLTAGFPCQDISSAGCGAGIQKGNRSGLWHHVIDAVRVLRPALLVVENVAALRWRGRGLGRVLGDLAQARYDASWTSIRASEVGAPHRRERLFLLACPEQPRRRAHSAALAARALTAGHATVAHAPGQRRDPIGHQPAGPAGTRPPGQPQRRGHRPERRATAIDLRTYRTTAVAADSDRDQRQRRGEPADLAGPSGPPPCPRRTLRLPAVDRGRVAVHQHNCVIDWGPYTDAIRHWEHVLGRPAPNPTDARPGKRPGLSPAFVEWLMGLDQGWVTDSPLSRTAQLRALGNGVLPRQSAHAISGLLCELNSSSQARPRERDDEAA